MDKTLKGKRKSGTTKYNNAIQEFFEQLKVFDIELYNSLNDCCTFRDFLSGFLFKYAVYYKERYAKSSKILYEYQYPLLILNKKTYKHLSERFGLTPNEINYILGSKMILESNKKLNYFYFKHVHKLLYDNNSCNMVYRDILVNKGFWRSVSVKKLVLTEKTDALISQVSKVYKALYLELMSKLKK